MTILKEKYNCWRIARAPKVAFLIDGAVYFEALAEAIEQAKENICIAAWDIDSRIPLRRPDGPDAGREGLGDLLNAKAKRSPGLQIYVLSWDFPMLYVREREWLPIFNLGWKTHRRIHFHLDDEHPIGASQHQKFVVIDNRVAFCGGIDLTNNRWDTPQHRVDDPRRQNPNGKPYLPFHDIQMAVSGDAAAALGELFSARWEWATGRRIDLSPGNSDDPWPQDLDPDLNDAQVGIVRTLPGYKGREEVREVQDLFKDGIAAARKSIYIENQYLTSVDITAALADSLARKQGPEIVLVLPRKSSGWLEQSTMDALRARILKKLFKADRYHRLGVFYPVLEDGKTGVYVHSKIMIIDDRLAIIGSANLSNRSMGFDSECNLALEAAADTTAGKRIAGLRNRLLAEHLGTSTDAVSKAITEQTSLIQIIESLPASERRLEILDYSQALPVDAIGIVSNPKLLDPEIPIVLDRMMDGFVHDENGHAKIRQVIKVTTVLLILLALAAAWRWTPLSEFIDSQNLAAWAGKIRGDPLSIPVVLGAYVVGGLLMIPITLIIGVTAMVYTPVWGTLFALGGCLLNALATYLIGSRLGKQAVRKLAGRKLNRLSRRMARQGIMTVAIIRNIPIAPFTVVNMIAGASHIRLKDYLIGTAIGMLPGILVITIFADRLLQTVQEPGWLNALIAAALAIALIAGSWWTKKRLARSSGFNA